jgi:hypothetical protein
MGVVGVLWAYWLYRVVIVMIGIQYNNEKVIHCKQVR